MIFIGAKNSVVNISFVIFKTQKIKLANNKILITGGATGIGFGLSEKFIKENNTVIVCGRRICIKRCSK